MLKSEECYDLSLDKWIPVPEMSEWWILKELKSIEQIMEFGLLFLICISPRYGRGS